MLKKGFFIMLIVVMMTNTCYGQTASLKKNSVTATGFKQQSKETYGDDTLHMYIHEKSGLQAIWIENTDTNRSFILGVRTPTVDATGVNHIIEHTLFTGSKKYPASSLFFDASSSYPHTYMNALTTGDMTMFPFATPYMSSYKALLDIYLDSIFNPNFLNVPYGFYEEAFNYEPQEKRIGGVVYNEMKGAYDNEDRKIYRFIRDSIYQTTHYGFDSGGDPNEIPKLTYKQFVDTYNRYYYPGNMMVVLYGDLPIDDILNHINSFIKNETMPREKVDLSVAPLKVPTTVKGNILNSDNKCALAKSFVMPRTLSVEEEVQMDLWINTYLGGYLSPIQQTLQKLGCQEIKILKDDDLPYMMYTLVVKNVPKEKMQLYNNILDQVLAKVFTMRQLENEKDMLLETRWGQMQSDEDEERSIFIPQTILDGWAHGKSETQYYIRKAYLSKLKEIKKDICHEIWEKTQVCTFFLMPGENVIVDPLTISQVAESDWQDIQKNMHIWQKQKVELAGISLDEMVLPEKLELNVKEKDEYTVLTTHVDTSFARSQLYYKTDYIKQEDLPYLFLYSYLLEENSREQVPFRGVIKTSCMAIPQESSYTPYFKISIVTDKEETKHGEILEEIRASLLNQKDDWYLYKLKKLINNSKGTSENNVLGTLSSLSLGGESREKRYIYEQGYPFYEWCKNCQKTADHSWIEKVKEMNDKLYNKEGLVIGITCKNKLTNPYLHSLEKMLAQENKIEKQDIKKQTYIFKQMPQQSFLQLETAVDYIYMQYTPETKIQGSDYVAAAYMSKNYLNPQIRINLGAYGAGCNCQYPFTFNIYTYRDPDFNRSLEIIKKSPEFLKNNTITQGELKASQTESLTRIHQQFKLLSQGIGGTDILEIQYLLGDEKNVVENLQLEIINTTTEQLKEKYRIFKDLLDKGNVSIATWKISKDTGKNKIYQFK